MQVRWSLIDRPLIGTVLLAIVVSAFGCASSKVSDLNVYQEVPMNRVVPYPPQDELRKRAFEIVVVDQRSAGFDDATLEVPREQVRRGLEGIAVDAGATVIDPLPADLNATLPETILSEPDDESPAADTGADYALAVRFLTYEYSSAWAKPFKFLWETPEDIAVKPGTCTHTVEVGFEVELLNGSAGDALEKTFAIEHQMEQKNKDIDTACTISPVTLAVLFETTVDEAISCLPFPLGGLLAPRGHVSSHRKAPEADRHIYRISLGSVQGIAPGDSIEIRREQRAMSPAGDESRSERVIATAQVTDKVMQEMSWIAVDPSKARSEILEGDVVRPIESEGLLASLSGPNCGSILEVR